MTDSFVTKTLALAAKDLRIEMRGRTTLPPMLAFSLVVVLLLAFSIPASPSPISPVRPEAGTVIAADVIAGFLWVTVLFAGLIGFARTFELERHGGAIDPLLLAPVDRSGLFIAKALANLTFIAAVEVFLLPVFALFFSFDLGARGWPLLILIVAIADIGFVSIGTLFAAIAAQTKSRELMLPVLALPMLVPIFIGAVELTSDLLLNVPFGDVTARGWFGLLVGYDVIFTVLSMLAFEFALE